MFGQSPYDERAFGFAFAALQCSMHGLRLMAERGLVSAADVWRVEQDVMNGIEIVPESTLTADGRATIVNTFRQIAETAATNWKDPPNA